MQNSSLKIFTAALMISGNTIGAGILGLPVLGGMAGALPSTIGLFTIWMVMLGTGFILAWRMINHGHDIQGAAVAVSQRTGAHWKRVCHHRLSDQLLWHSGGLSVRGGDHHHPPLQHRYSGIRCHAYSFHRSDRRHPVWRGSGSQKQRGIDGAAFCGICVSDSSLRKERTSPMVPVCGTGDSFQRFFQYSSRAFTYHNTIPIVVRVLDYDRPSVQKALIVGTAIPLVLSVLWTLSAIGCLPLKGSGNNTIYHAFKENLPATIPLAHILDSGIFTTVSLIFSLLAIATSYLAVGTGLLNFMKDLTRPFFKRRNRATGCSSGFWSAPVHHPLLPRPFSDRIECSGGSGALGWYSGYCRA